MSYQSITADVVKLGDHLPAVSAGEVSNGSVKKTYPKCLHIMTFKTDYIYRTFSEIRSRKHCIMLTFLPPLVSKLWSLPAAVSLSFLRQEKLHLMLVGFKSSSR